MVQTEGETLQIIEEEVVWSRPDGVELLANVFRPEAASATLRPVLVNVHGGAWSSGHRKQGVLYCRALASAGIVVATVEFRQGPEHQHPAASIDVLNAVRWARLHAEGWGGSPEAIGLVGSSSGGHLALLAATLPDSPEYLDVPPIVDIDGEARVRGDVDPRAAYVVGLWPVSDPHYRYRYARRAGMSDLASLTEAYFPDEATMRRASVPRIVTAGEATRLPPALVVQPGEDANVPVEMTFDLLRAWQSRGGHIEYAFFPEQAHTFGHRPSPETDDMVELVRDFVSRYGPH